MAEANCSCSNPRYFFSEREIILIMHLEDKMKQNLEAVSLKALATKRCHSPKIRGVQIEPKRQT